MHRISLVLAGAACALVASAGAASAASAATQFCATGQHIKGNACVSDGAKDVKATSHQTGGSAGATNAFKGGVSVAAGDVNGDGRAFEACATGEHIKTNACASGGAKAAGLTKQGAGTMTLSGGAKAGAKAPTGGTFTNAAGGTVSGVKTFTATVSDTGGPARAANTYSGSTTVNAGTLSKAKATSKTASEPGDMPK